MKGVDNTGDAVSQMKRKKGTAIIMTTVGFLERPDFARVRKIFKDGAE